MTIVPPKEQDAVLLVSNDLSSLERNRLMLMNTGIRPVLAIADSRATLAFLKQHAISVIVLDISTAMGRDELLARICKEYPNIQVIVESESNDVETAVSCMKSGAVDYMVRPIEPGRLILAVENALNCNQSSQEVSSLKEYMLSDRLKHAEVFAEIKTVCRKMRSIFQYTEVVACSPQPVLITGETGVGKELFAHAIHRISEARGQFVSINVAGLDDAMFSDTLFGHKKGFPTLTGYYV